MDSFQGRLEETGLVDGRGLIGWNIVATPRRGGWPVPVRAELVPGPSVLPDPWQGRDISGPWVACVMRDSDIAAGAIKWSPPDVSGMLDRFIAVASGDDKRVVNFVLRWGLLPLCAHLWPSRHDKRCQDAAYFGGDSTMGYPSPPSGFSVWQPVAAIRHWARHFSALVRLAMDLSKERPGGDDDLRIIYEWDRGSPPRPEVGSDALQRVAFGKTVVTERINQLLDWVDTQIQCVWALDDPRPYLFGLNDPFSALTLQLVHALSAAEFRAICFACGRPYAPRRLRSGELHFCPECGPNAAKLFWSRRNPEKRRRQRKEANGDGEE